jgi:hypothetical protein
MVYFLKDDRKLLHLSETQKLSSPDDYRRIKKVPIFENPTMKKLLCFVLYLCFHHVAFAQDSLKIETPDTVRIGAYVISVHDINFHDKEYTIRFWLWFLHNNAEFDFSRQLDIPNAKSIEFAEPITDSLDGKAWVIMKMKCVMKQNWIVSDFPFDQQKLSLHIENTLFDNTSLIFLPDTTGSRFDDEEAIDGWTITNFKVRADVNDYHTGFGAVHPDSQYSEFSQFVLEMDIERNAFGLFMKIFTGMYIAFLIAIISFTPHPSELEPRFGLPVGGLFAAVGNKYIIDSLLPQASSFTLVDTLHTITFLSILATLVISAVALKLHDYGKTEKALRINRIYSRIVVMLYFVLNIVFITEAYL